MQGRTPVCYVRQIVLKYMDEEGNVTLPASGTSNGGYTPPADSGGSSSGGSDGGGGSDRGSGDDSQYE